MLYHYLFKIYLNIMEPISLGFSPCPNDTYIFYALVHGLIESELIFAEPQLEDVETLNFWAMQKKLDVTKLSFHALGHVLDDYCVLSSGSALGRGCGPLLVASKNVEPSSIGNLKIGIPGKYTTAALLMQMYQPHCTNLVEMRFEKIIPSILDKTIDAGVIIHESRFTYQQEGLVCLQDLGQWWEETSSMPIPLGCIAAKRSLGSRRIREIDNCIKKSLHFARQQPKACLPYIKSYSQEMDENVVQDHIGLYVNDFSSDLGAEGMDAVRRFLERGREAGILPLSTMPLFN